MPLEKIAKDMTDMGVEPAKRALEAFKNYREREEQLKPVNEFPERSEEREAELGEKVKSADASLHEIAMRIHKCARDGFFIIRVCQLKILYLVKALEHALEDRNPLSLANNTRALVEHTAALTFVGKVLRNLQNGLGGQNSEKKVNESLSRAEKTLERCYYGTSPKGPKSGKPKAPHIQSECLAALKEEAAGIDEIYDFLCEYVHPNYGSNALVSTGILGRGQLDPPPDFHREAIDAFCVGCIFCLDYLGIAEIRFFRSCIELDDLVHRCLTPGAKLTNVFSKRPPKASGDGKSKETAYFFPKARTHMEAMEMAYRSLAERDIPEDCMKVVAGYEDKFFYEYWDAPDGKIWFKYKQELMPGFAE